MQAIPLNQGRCRPEDVVIGQLYSLENDDLVYATLPQYIEIGDRAWSLPDRPPYSVEEMWPVRYVDSVVGDNTHLVYRMDQSRFTSAHFGGYLQPSRICVCGITIPGPLTPFRHLCKS